MHSHGDEWVVPVSQLVVGDNLFVVKGGVSKFDLYTISSQVEADFKAADDTLGQELNRFVNRVADEIS